MLLSLSLFLKHLNRKKMQTRGTIKTIFQTERVSDKFSKRLLWLTIDEQSQYPQTVQFEFTQDKTTLLDNFSEGQQVEVEFNLRGKMWAKDGKVVCFNTLQAWKIKLQEGQPAQEVHVPRQAAPAKVENAPLVDYTDQLPF